MELKRASENTTIIVSGSWNPRIFNPSWMCGGRLTAQKDVEVEVAINDLGRPHRYKFEDITLSASSSKLNVSCIKETGATHQKMEQVVKICCQTLEHTPVGAAGINYIYKLSDPNSRLLSIFDGSDQGYASDACYTIEASLVKRVVSNGQWKMNISLSNGPEDESIMLNFNFERRISTPNEVTDFIEGAIDEKYTEAMRYIEALCGERINLTE